jgi:putative transposase
MAYVKILIHGVWGTKNRYSYFDETIRPQVWKHIKENATTKGIYIDAVNGYSDHVHCLFYLNADISLAKHIQLIKGESSFWLNRSGLLKTKFEWADKYFAASVSEDKIQIVRNYLATKEDHHKKETFIDEYDRFLKNYGFEENQG